MQRNLKAVNFLVKAYLRSQKEKRQLYLRYTFVLLLLPISTTFFRLQTYNGGLVCVSTFSGNELI